MPPSDKSTVFSNEPFPNTCEPYLPPPILLTNAARSFPGTIQNYVALSTSDIARFIPIKFDNYVELVLQKLNVHIRLCSAVLHVEPTWRR